VTVDPGQMQPQCPPLQDHQVVVQALVKIRVGRGLTQQQVADRMGCDRSNVGHWEAGKHDLRLSSLLRYTRAIGVRLSAELVDLPELEGGGVR
jgi:transcriptional regulator with XRE-family HTH domain